MVTIDRGLAADVHADVIHCSDGRRNELIAKRRQRLLGCVVGAVPRQGHGEHRNGVRRVGRLVDRLMHGAALQRLPLEVGHCRLNHRVAGVVRLDDDGCRHIGVRKRLLDMLQRRQPGQARWEVVDTRVVDLEVQSRRSDSQQDCHRQHRSAGGSAQHLRQDGAPNTGLLPLGASTPERDPDAALVDMTAEQRQGCG